MLPGVKLNNGNNNTQQQQQRRNFAQQPAKKHDRSFGSKMNENKAQHGHWSYTADNGKLIITNCTLII